MSTEHTGYKYDEDRSTVDVECGACGKRITLGFVKNDESPARMVLNWEEHIKNDGCDAQSDHREPFGGFNNQPPKPWKLGPTRDQSIGPNHDLTRIHKDDDSGTIDNVKCIECHEIIQLGFTKNDRKTRLELDWDAHINNDGCDPDAEEKPRRGRGGKNWKCKSSGRGSGRGGNK
jgi:hypothetical protein